MTDRSPIRVLHVLGSLGVGGVETWLVRMSRALDRDRFALDFQLHVPDEGPYATAVRQLGSRVFVNPHTRSPGRYAAALSRVLRREGPYDVVHSHVHDFSGLVLAVAAMNGVGRRVAHAHTDSTTTDRRGPARRRVYLSAMRRLIARFMCAGLAASGEAARSLFGERWAEDGRVRLLPCGLDLTVFDAALDPAAVRDELGLPVDAPVVGHVGRFDEPKNHGFLVDVAVEVVRALPSARFLWVGDGPLRARTVERVRESGLSDRIVMPGSRADVPRLLAAMDTFVFPSLWEGMPVSLVEAQASGLPCTVSSSVTREACVVTDLVTRLPLDAGAAAWGRAVVRALEARDRSRERARRGALETLRDTPFDVRAGARALESLYAGAGAGGCRP